MNDAPPAQEATRDSTPLEPVLWARLAFAQYLYALGVRQSRQPEPLRSASLLMFHDALEFFLDVAAARHNVTEKLGSFEEYFGTLNKRIEPKQLPERAGVLRLNKARVALKHHGTMPSGLDIESYRATTTAFLRGSAPLLFGVEFDSISMVDLVQNEEARKRLGEAVVLARTGKRREAALTANVALDVAVNAFEARCANEFGARPFFFGWGMGGVRQNLSHSRREDAVDRAFTAITTTIDELQHVTRLMALGLDIRRYRRFSAIVARGYDSAAESVTSEQWQYCLDYVIDVALALQQFDRELQGAGPGDE